MMGETRDVTALDILELGGMCYDGREQGCYSH